MGRTGDAGDTGGRPGKSVAGQPGGNPYPYGVTPTVAFLPGGQYMTSAYDICRRPLHTRGTFQCSGNWYELGGVGLLFGEPRTASVYQPGDQLWAACGQRGGHWLRTHGYQLHGGRESAGAARLSLQNGVVNPAGVQVGNMDSWYPYGTQLV